MLLLSLTAIASINIVEADGTLRMVLSNNRRIPNIIVRGREYPDFNNRHASTAAGILFYDAQATESGGLTFGGRKELERIQSLPPDQQQAEIARFLETHPLGAGTRAILANENGNAALQFLNENGQVTHRYPPAQP